MWRDRLIRLLLVGLALAVLLGMAKTFSGKLGDNFLRGKKIPEVQLEKVLGAASQILRRKGREPKKQTPASPEEEPITEPVEKIEKQTQTLIESIKKLPEDQVKAIKKQIYKEFCESLLDEEE